MQSTMEHSPVVEARIRNRAAVEAVFGSWSSFHDCLLLALRLDAEADAAPTVEIDILAPRGYEKRGEGYEGVDHHCVTLRFLRATGVVVADFLSANLIAELKLGFVHPPNPTESRLRVELQPISGCGGELALHCDEIEVVSVVERRSNVPLKPTVAAIDARASRSPLLGAPAAERWAR